MESLKLKFDCEDGGNCRTYYKLNNRRIVVIHEKNFDNILTATEDGEPEADLKAGLNIEIDKEQYHTISENGYTKLIKNEKEVK